MIQRWYRRVVFLFTLLGFLVFLVTVTPLTGWYALKLAGPWPDSVGDILIIPGAAPPNFGVLDNGTYWRCAYAAAAWRTSSFRRVVVTGKGVAPGMRDFLVFSGIPAEQILVEDESGSTRENALFTARLLAEVPGRKVLLTSDSHMFRAHRTFRKAGLDTLPRPVPDMVKRAGYWESRWPIFVAEVIETCKIVYYYARGWI